MDASFVEAGADYHVLGVMIGAALEEEPVVLGDELRAELCAPDRGGIVWLMRVAVIQPAIRVWAVPHFFHGVEGRNNVLFDIDEKQSFAPAFGPVFTVVPVVIEQGDQYRAWAGAEGFAPEMCEREEYPHRT
jgi:hypothetical protein